MLTKSRHWYRIKKLVPGNIYEPLLDKYYSLRKFNYKGNKVQCPICEETFSSFIKGHVCPGCGSGKRHRLLYLYLKQRTNFFEAPLRVLHFAPEHCFYKRFSALPNLAYTSADLSSPRAMVKIDMTNIQYPRDSFDVVISSHVLEHVSDDLKAMQELRRIVKADGWSIHQAPVHYDIEFTYENAEIKTNEARLKHYGHFDHKRLYGADYKKRLTIAGFEVIEDDFVNNFSEEDIFRYGLDTTERIYLCRKLEMANPNNSSS